jgi:SAM-dependent methyltransferase
MLRLLTRFDRPRTAPSGAMRRIYDAAAAGWQNGMTRLGFVEAYRHLMAQVVPQATARSVLDVGTGTGAFAAAWTDVHGIPEALSVMDVSPAMLDVATNRLPQARPILAGLGGPLGDIGPQDIVLCAHVIEHLDDPHEALEWLHDQLRPGGTLVVALSRPHWCTALVRWRWGNAAYTPERGADMLRRAGFADIRTHRFPKGPPSRVSCGYTAQRPG